MIQIFQNFSIFSQFFQICGLKMSESGDGGLIFLICVGIVLFSVVTGGLLALLDMSNQRKKLTYLIANNNKTRSYGSIAGTSGS